MRLDHTGGTVAGGSGKPAVEVAAVGLAVAPVGVDGSARHAIRTTMATTSGAPNGTRLLTGRGWAASGRLVKRWKPWRRDECAKEARHPGLRRGRRRARCDGRVSQRSPMSRGDSGGHRTIVAQANNGAATNSAMVNGSVRWISVAPPSAITAAMTYAVNRGWPTTRIATRQPTSARPRRGIPKIGDRRRRRRRRTRVAGRQAFRSSLRSIQRTTLLKGRTRTPRPRQTPARSATRSSRRTTGPLEVTCYAQVAEYTEQDAV